MHDLERILGVKNNTDAVIAVMATVSKIFKCFVVRYFLRIKFSSKLTYMKNDPRRPPKMPNTTKKGKS